MEGELAYCVCVHYHFLFFCKVTSICFVLSSGFLSGFFIRGGKLDNPGGRLQAPEGRSLGGSRGMPPPKIILSLDSGATVMQHPESVLGQFIFQL